MSKFDLSDIAAHDEGKTRVMGHLNNSEEMPRFNEYVKAYNERRIELGLKPVDAKFHVPKLIMRGLDTMETELPDYLVSKIKKARKKRNNDNQDSEGENNEEAREAAE
jgi:hypothetical protein